MKIFTPLLSVLLCSCVFGSADIQPAEAVSIFTALHFPKSRADYDQRPILLRGEMPETSYVLDQETNKVSVVTGKVVVGFTIASDGTTSNIKAVKGKDACKAAAIDAVKGWQFSPAKKDGQVVAIDVTVPFIFKPD